MFGWFKKKHQQDKSSLPESIERMMMTKSLATAIADHVSSYSKDVQDGKLLPTPAYIHVDDYSILDIWRFTRLEALSHLYSHRGSDVLLLAEPPIQKKILDFFFENKPQDEHSRQPSNDPIHNIIQAMYEVYSYLSKAGSAVADGETCNLRLRSKNKTIFCEFETNAQQLRVQWDKFDSVKLPPFPPFILEVLYKDVTKKSKTIALTAKLGPDYEGNLKGLLQAMRERLTDEEVRTVQETYQKVLTAQDPDHI
jgi:hypothetical protein